MWLLPIALVLIGLCDRAAPFQLPAPSARPKHVVLSAQVGHMWCEVTSRRLVRLECMIRGRRRRILRKGEAFASASSILQTGKIS
jgi:hypothetical protein